MTSESPLQIDVLGIIKSKNPKAAKRIPRFVIRYLERIIHQQELNKFLKDRQGLVDMDFVRSAIKYMDLSIEFSGFENIPSGGKFLFAANHPLGGLESLVFMEIISQKFDNFVFVVNDILMALKPMSGLFIPVNKVGSQSRESVDKVNSAYSSEKQILFFPAGLVSRRTRGKIVDPPWQKSFVSKAVESKRDIIPVYIEGRNSNFFYRLANFRKFLGIKTNIEMLYLVDEMVKQKGNTIKIVFGKPIPYTKFDKSKTYIEWAAYLKDIVYSMK
ncbi:MAG: 1-acyl-sn-glycerol-3-phosphate acyltransferase [Bacteroidales bacterium]|nr:1-acyl-sn-glycerol-3-phosphate acyltransferase [Bacteroidales bacterium]